MPGAGVGGTCPVGVGLTGVGLQVGLHFAFVGHLVGHCVGLHLLSFLATDLFARTATRRRKKLKAIFMVWMW